MTAPSSTTARGNRFEDYVATLLRLFGYTVQQNVSVSGSQIDIRAMVELPTHSDTLLVECKAHERALGVDAVRAFYALIADAPADTRGLFVSTNDFTSDAKKFAEDKRRITVTSVRDLERKVIDPSHYLRKLVETFPEAEVAHMYVPLKCVDEASQTHSSGEQAILDSLQNEDVSFIALLGEYGSGKTTLIGRVEYRLAATYVSQRLGRIPLRVNLGEYTKAFNLRQLITDILVHRFGVRNPQYELFEELNRQGKLLLLFDGFDEMSTKVDDTVVRENFFEIQRLCTGAAKVILSCRSSFFRDREQQDDVLRVRKDSLRETIEGSETPGTKRLILLPLSWDQIEAIVFKREKYLSRRATARLDANAVLGKIRNTYNLAELAQRPFLLEMILRSVPHMGRSARSLTPGVLYEIYTDRWVERDRERGRTLATPAQRKYFAEELAYEMYRNGQVFLHWRRIPEWIDSRIGVPDKHKDYYDYDVRACNYLSRNEAGFYGFAHRSFMEFFTACRLLRVLRKAQDVSILGEIQITEEIGQFAIDVGGNVVGDNLGEMLNRISFADRTFEGQEEKIYRRNVLQLLTRLGPVRSIGPLLVYLRGGRHKFLRSYITHHVAEHITPILESNKFAAMLTAMSIALRGKSLGLDVTAAARYWPRMPRVVRQELRWSFAELQSNDPERFLTRATKEFAAADHSRSANTTAEIAFAICCDEEEVIRRLKQNTK